MAKPWIPKNFDEAAKRHAGRRKLHMRKRKARADRIVRILGTKQAALELRDCPYGWLSVAAQVMNLSKATVSRDFALVRRIHLQFRRLFGRAFDPMRDQIVWTWNWNAYGFIAPESKNVGYPKPIGKFPFDTRIQETDESYCGFNQLSWQNTDYRSEFSRRDWAKSLNWALNILLGARRS